MYNRPHDVGQQNPPSVIQPAETQPRQQAPIITERKMYAPEIRAAIRRTKTELKAQAAEIRRMKPLRKKKNGNTSDGWVKGLVESRQDFRIKHVAYCLVRGRTMQQIEPTASKFGYPINKKWFEARVDYRRREILGETKLYVLVNGALQLTPSQMAVQAGHAVASFCKAHPESLWSNGTLVYLLDPQGDFFRYASADANVSIFREPDLKDAPTAAAIHHPDFECRASNYKLLNLPTVTAA